MSRSDHGIDYSAIRAAISLKQVLETLGFRPTHLRGSSWRGPCPLHDTAKDAVRHFSANLHRNLFRCFRCGAAGNQLDLWVAHTQLPLYQAAIDLCRRHGICPPRRPASQPNLQPRKRPQPTRKPANRQGHWL